jgi:hypothetical protein
MEDGTQVYLVRGFGARYDTSRSSKSVVAQIVGRDEQRWCSQTTRGDSSHCDHASGSIVWKYLLSNIFSGQFPLANGRVSVIERYEGEGDGGVKNIRVF